MSYDALRCRDCDVVISDSEEPLRCIRLRLNWFELLGQYCLLTALPEMLVALFLRPA